MAPAAAAASVARAMRDDTPRLRKILARIDERLVRLPASAERDRLVDLGDAIRRYLDDRPVEVRR